MKQVGGIRFEDCAFLVAPSSSVMHSHQLILGVLVIDAATMVLVWRYHRLLAVLKIIELVRKVDVGEHVT